MDPLTLLRDFTKNGKKVLLENDQFIFDSLTYPRTIETAFRSRRGEGPPYTLDAIWFMLQHADKKFTDYLAECRKYKFPHVSLIDKKDLISYLNGEIDTCASIQVIPDVPTIFDDTTADSERPQDDRATKRAKTDNISEMEDDETVRKEKEEYQKNFEDLHKLQDNASSSKVVSDLGPGLTVDKIKELQQKRKAQKAKSVKGGEPQIQVLKGKFLEADAEITKNIISKEKLLHNRTTVLQTKNKKTFNTLIDLALATMQKEEQLKRNLKSKGYDRYQEVEEDKFWKDRLKGTDALEFGIDTRGTFADFGKMPDASQLQSKKSTDKQRSKMEISANVPIKLDPKDAIPIIIVPSALTSAITMYNVKEFLGEGIFVPTIEKRNSGAKKETMITIDRKKGNHSIQYQIIDNTSKLSSRDWNRVAGVFVLGQTWQFKGWRWESPLDIFTKIAGFYMYYEEEGIPDAIKQWPLKYLAISKMTSKKHLARAAVLEFWDSLDHYIATKKPYLNQ